MTSATARPVIIDTDGGVDDAAALWWALTDPGIDLIAVTAVDGVVPAAIAARNVLKVLAAAGRSDIPVGIGSGPRLGPVPKLRSTDFIHGADGLGDTTTGEPVSAHELDAADELLYRLCAARPGIVSVVSIGPLTNLARTIERHSDWAGHVREFVAMAGSARAGGNALPAGESNVASDPVAAAMVVAADWAHPPLMIGLDVTHAATLTQSEFDLLAQHRSHAARFLDAPLRFYRTYGSTFTAPECPCHDLLAVMALSMPGLITEAPLLPLAIDTSQGPGWGATIVDFRALAFAKLSGAQQQRPEGFHDWRIAMRVDVSQFRRGLRSLLGA